LAVALDFLDYLQEREGSAATVELLQIPDLGISLQDAERQASAGELTDWRRIRRDA
jgi:hypothetical protein